MFLSFQACVRFDLAPPGVCYDTPTTPDPTNPTTEYVPTTTPFVPTTEKKTTTPEPTTQPPTTQPPTTQEPTTTTTTAAPTTTPDASEDCEFDGKKITSFKSTQTHNVTHSIGCNDLNVKWLDLKPYLSCRPKTSISWKLPRLLCLL